MRGVRGSLILWQRFGRLLSMFRLGGFRGLFQVVQHLVLGEVRLPLVGPDMEASYQFQLMVRGSDQVIEGIAVGDQFVCRKPDRAL